MDITTLDTDGMVKLHKMIKDHRAFTRDAMENMPEFPFREPLFFGKAQWRALKKMDHIWKESMKVNLHHTNLLLQFIEQELDYQLTQ